MGIEQIGKEAINTLKSKAIGGVSKESATASIEKVVNAAKEEIKQLSETVTSQSSRITQLSGDCKLAQEALAKAKADSAYAATKSAETEKILKKNLEKAKATKIGKPKINKNGNTEITKVNKNGAKETLETLPDGRKVSAKFENIDGDIIKYYYDPVTGKPVKVYKNIGAKETLTELSGNTSKTKEVNAKKAPKEKPTVVNREKLETKNGVTTYRKTYSDGTYESVQYNDYSKKALSSTKYNTEGKKIESIDYSYNNENSSLNYTKIETYNPKTGKISKSVCERKQKKEIRFYNDNGVLVKEIYEQPLYTSIVNKPIDEFGNVGEHSDHVTHVFPKNSRIKKSYTQFRQPSSFYVEQETLTLRDGSIVTMKLDGNYNPYNVVITKKGSEPISLERTESKEFLKDVGFFDLLENDSSNYLKH